MIEKLVKEFEKIRVSLAKSKKLIIADIDKIDEKYRKLAQEEKKSLTESLAVLNEQLKYYDKMLYGGQSVEVPSDESAKEEQEDVIQDTIFPENNEPEEEEKKEEKEEKEEEKPADLDTEEDAEQGLKIESGEIKEVESSTDNSDAWITSEETESEKKEPVEEEEPAPEVNVDENGWPIPDDWK